MLAAHELASSAVRHGAGAGRLRMWAQDGTLRCQVDDADAPGLNGRATAAQRVGGAAAAEGWPYRLGHGLWLVRQVADQLSVSTGSAGTCATVVFTMPATAAGQP